MNPQYRAYLEEIATSHDSAVRPGDRIRAFELLQDTVEEGECPRCSALESLDDEALDAALDTHSLDLVRRALADDDRLPRTAAAIRAEIDRRVREEVKRCTDVEQVEREIERRAEERARELYRSRAFEVVDGSSRPEEDQETSSEGNTVSEPVRAVEKRVARPMIIPPGIDLERGWSK